MSKPESTVVSRDLEQSSQLSRSTVLLMALATGLAVANLYYCQPLLHVISNSLHISEGSVGILVTMTQIGYALGLLFVIPLGDLLERRKLICATSLISVAALALTALAANEPWLLVASAAVGLLSVLAQILVPMAADLASPADRGSVVGTVMSGLLMGILLARTFAGLLAEVGGWRAVYLVAAGLMLVLTVALWRGLPDSPVRTHHHYGQLMASVLALVTGEPVLRRRMAYGFLSFAQFSVLWTALTGLLSAGPFHYSEGVIGLFGLVGAAGAVSAQAAGRLADRGRSLLATIVYSLLLIGSWVALYFGARSLLPLLIGIILLDLAVQGLQVTNQSQIYTLAADARSRINSAYMTSYFAGGALASWVATKVAAGHGWHGVCILGGLSAVALLLVVGVGESTLPRALARRSARDADPAMA